MATLSSEQQVRLMIWTIPRTVSTALAKCLSFVDNSKVFFENYTISMAKDPARMLEQYQNAELERALIARYIEISEVEGATPGLDESLDHQWIKEQLEKDHVEKKLILCKDMAYAVTDQTEFLPKGYRHLFLIRHPLEVFPSWKRLYQGLAKMSPDKFCLTELPPRYFPKDYGFRELLELFEHVKKELDQEAIIIDADDLLQDPEGILSALFKLIGLPFEEKLLTWEAGSAVMQNWTISKFSLQGQQLAGFYQNAMESTCFMKPGPLLDRSSLSADILRLVDASMPYYDKLYAQRLSA